MPPTQLPLSVRRLLLGVLLALHVFAAVICASLPLDQAGHNVTFGLLLGLCCGQASVAAAWLALGPGRFLSRLSVSLFIVALACLPLLAEGLRHGEMIVVLAIDGALVAQFALVQWPLWVLRTRRGWHLGLPDEAPPLQDKQTQFGIGQLLLWTAGVACILGIARLVLPTDAIVRLGVGRVELMGVLFLLLLVFHTLLPLPLVFGALAARRMPLWVTGAILFTVFITWIEPWMFRLLMPQPGDEGSLFWWLNGSHVCWLLGSLFVLRICGYRLPAMASDQISNLKSHI